MQRTIEETNRRRAKQQRYNEEHGITPHQVGIKAYNALVRTDIYQREDDLHKQARYLEEDPVIGKMDATQLKEAVAAAKKRMEDAAAQLDFLAAAQARDEMNALKLLLEK